MLDGVGSRIVIGRGEHGFLSVFPKGILKPLPPILRLA
jgi:hypothetical protein